MKKFCIGLECPYYIFDSCIVKALDQDKPCRKNTDGSLIEEAALLHTLKTTSSRGIVLNG